MYKMKTMQPRALALASSYPGFLEELGFTTNTSIHQLHARGPWRYLIKIKRNGADIGTVYGRPKETNKRIVARVVAFALRLR